METRVVLVKGAGDLGSGIMLRLHRAGFEVLATEVARPMAVRRTVAFCEAVYTGEIEVEGVRARLVEGLNSIGRAWEQGVIPVLVDPEASCMKTLRPAAVVDAIMAKRNLGTHVRQAKVVIGVGPGFTAGVDVHAVVETQRGHNLGRVLWHGSAAPNTGVPGEIGGFGIERLLRAPCAGVLRSQRMIGDHLQAGEIVCWVDEMPVKSEISGVLRGLLRDGSVVPSGMKIGDVDPRASRQHCFTVSDKSLAVGGGVVEAVFVGLQSPC